MKIEINCCEGSESRYGDQCLRSRCPVYSQAREKVDKDWPFMATGFGNAYGNPSHGIYLAEVHSQLQAEQEKSFEPDAE